MPAWPRLHGIYSRQPSVQSIKLAILKTSHVVAVGSNNNRNRTVTVPWGEVRRFGGRGVDAMMSRANVALGH